MNDRPITKRKSEQYQVFLVNIRGEYSFLAILTEWR